MRTLGKMQHNRGPHIKTLGNQVARNIDPCPSNFMRRYFHMHEKCIGSLRVCLDEEKVKINEDERTVNSSNVYNGQFSSLAFSAYFLIIKPNLSI